MMIIIVVRNNMIILKKSENFGPDSFLIDRKVSYLVIVCNLPFRNRFITHISYIDITVLLNYQYLK